MTHHSNIIFVAHIFFGAILTTAANGTASAAKNFNIDGFKDIKLDSRTADLVEKGFKCVNDYKACEVKDGIKNNRTLFGQPTRISAKYTDDIIDTISVTIDITPDSMIENFSTTLGKPIEHNYISFAGYKVRQFIWISSSKTSISVTKNLDKTDQKNLFGQITPINFSTADYLNKKKTTELLEKIQGARIDKSDF